MPDHDHIYHFQAERYEQMISRQPGLLPVIRAIRPVEGLDIIDAGAGTGRLAAVLAPYARSIIALDEAEAMLEVASRKLAAICPDHWRCIPADNRSLPLPDCSADLLVSGWSVCYLASSNHPGWQESLARVLGEFKRVLRPGGTIILFETMGTGFKEPNPPGFLLSYYEALTQQYGFSSQLLSLDYRFADIQEAEELTGLFFGEELVRLVREEYGPVVPEFAGMWWLTLPGQA